MQLTAHGTCEMEVGKAGNPLKGGHGYEINATYLREATLAQKPSTTDRNDHFLIVEAKICKVCGEFPKFL